MCAESHIGGRSRSYNLSLETAPFLLRNAVSRDEDYKPPFTFTGKIKKIALTIDRPKLSPEDIKKLEEAQRNAEKDRE